MGSTSKLCEIADAGPLVHTMSWEEIGKACGDASLRIAELEAAMVTLLRATSNQAVMREHEREAWREAERVLTKR